MRTFFRISLPDCLVAIQESRKSPSGEDMQKKELSEKPGQWARGAAGCSLGSRHCKKGKEPSITPASLVFSWLPWVGGGWGCKPIKKEEEKNKKL